MGMQWRRIRTWVKWACTLLSVVIVAVWAGSRSWQVYWMGSGWERHQFGTVMLGGIDADWTRRSPIASQVSFAPVKFRVQRITANVAMPSYWLPRFESDTITGKLVIPLYLPLALTLAPAAFLWHREIRRRLVKAGACATCGYDRAGLAPDAKCPECGRVAAASATDVPGSPTSG